MLNEKGMIPKDKGWGMSNLGLWGKNPCFTTFVLFATFLVLPNLSNLFNVLFCLLGVVMAELLGVVIA